MSSKVILWAVVLISGCKYLNDNNKGMNQFNYIAYQDPHSYAKPNHARMEHLSLELTVDFRNENVSGFAKLKLAEHKQTKLFLDTKDLVIERILIDDKLTVFKLHPADSILGSKLEVSINSTDRFVTIYYRTKRLGGALQWLSPEQTSSKTKAMLFTQSQFILARSWIPCQDSPGLRFTFDAKITVPKGYMALMSAQNPTQINSDGVYYFRQERPIPAYLMSLSVGDFHFKSIGRRTGVYAEFNVIERAADEFRDIEKMLEVAEKLFGTYQWGRYDVLVLPPSFPFGGMENPCLTYVSPTILAGDRSLVSMLAHELAHSWSGNWVTNATWEDFWLNEGFTVYSEYRIMEEIYGKPFADMMSSISALNLKNEIRQIENQQDSKLKLSLKDRDPVDAMTPIAYYKGYFFLKRIEFAVGRPVWDDFLRKYYKDFALKSLTTEEFVFYLEGGLKNWKDFGIDKWLYGVGLPDDFLPTESDKVSEAKSYASLFSKKEVSANEVPKNWSYPQWIVFLSELPKPLPLHQLYELDKVFALTKAKNSEISFAWFVHCIASHYEPSYPEIESFLMEVGRRKFAYNLFYLMVNDEELRSFARQIYKRSRAKYHYVTYSSIDQLFSKYTQGD